MKYIGNCEWEPYTPPVPGVSDWGVDTLSCEYKGRADKYEAFLATLRQGQVKLFAGTTWYLQTWSAKNDRVFPEVALLYKGFISGNPPAGTQADGSSVKSLTKVISLRREGGTYEDRTYEIQYIAPTCTYRYIGNGRGFAGGLLVNLSQPTIIQSYYTKDDNGRKYQGIPPGTLSMRAIEESKTDNPIYGTPYFEKQITMASVIEP